MEQARLFMSGGSQAVRLPRSYRFEGDRVLIKRMGNAVILLPRDDPWRSLLDAVALFSDDFMEQRGQPEQQARGSAFE